ncbi:Hsp33 family molecular chaperone HslO [Erythrobacter arachoides]|uniref:Hsp33 family molecular chaperone HslO n=1 Tax=Aurantiacibacter arachoides TaxID=1850444 RepID=A0A845A6H5_9SPHN|nr:Hsp33 family molecular chaperone HslO [Aurantiacibacter arachoides]MXO94527.1 Hsp33 family molecular chaperone HslO [Aurantiacibacter arachoides]
MTDAHSQTFSDRLLGFAIPSRDCRGRAVRLGPVIEDILSAHDYAAPLKHCLAEALVVTALMGGLLKDEGDQLTVQAQGEGGIASLLACDYRGGELRGYIQHDRESEMDAGANPSLETLFGKGHLAITFDIASTGQRYQGIVPLEGASLAEAIETYFAQSEQVPTRIRTAITIHGAECVAAGMLIQHLPEGEEGRERLHARLDHPHWEHIAILAESLRHEELADVSLSLEDLVWRLYHEEDEVRVMPGPALGKGCRCSAVHFEEILSRFPKDDRREMANDDGIIVVDCAFCSKEFAILD